MAHYKDLPDLENVAYKIKVGAFNPDWNKLAHYENFTSKVVELMTYLFPDYVEKYGNKNKKYFKDKWLQLHTSDVYEIQTQVETILRNLSKCEHNNAAIQMQKTNADLHDEINKKDKEIAKLLNEFQILKDQNKNFRTEVIQLKQTVESKNNELANMEISKKNTIDQLLDKLVRPHKI